MGERHCRRGACYSGQVVMLGHPETPVAERLDMPRKVEQILERLTGVPAFDDWRKVQNGKWNRRPNQHCISSMLTPSGAAT